MDQLLAMKAFVASVKCGNLGHAAEQLGVSRALVSRQIKALEESINSHLMIRTTRSLSLTEAGEKYFLFCEGALAEIERMDAQIRSENREIRGELPVLSPKWLGPVVARILSEFIRLHPDVQPRLMLESLPLTAYEFLARGCEVSFNMRTIPNSRIVARKLFDLRYTLCASPKFLAGIATPEHPADLQTLPALVQTISPNWDFARDGATERVLPKPAFLSDSYVALHAAALAGAGLTQIPHSILHEDLSSGKLVEVLPDWECEPQPIYVSYAPGQASSARAQAFARFAADWFRANPL